MALLLGVCMILIPAVIGSGMLIILYEKKQESTFFPEDALLLGMIAMLGAAEAAHLSIVIAGLPFSFGVPVFGGLMGLLSILSLVLISARYIHRSRRQSRARGKFDDPLSLLFLIFVLLVLSQSVYILMGNGVWLRGDITVEAVESFLYTNRIYQVNPLTGAPYQGGIPFRLEILCLPTLYGILCKMFGLTPQTVAWTVVPLVMLLYGYAAFSCLGRCIFPQDKKKRNIFLMVTALLLWIGTYHFAVDGFGILCSGWRGVVIRNVVLMPYLLSLCLRKRWVAAFLCIVAEACIVWTLYGAGTCLFAAAAMGVLSLVRHRQERVRGKGAVE